MSKSVRIRTTPNGGDNFIKVKLDQSFDFLEVLSLKISQAELYRIFAADYGVIVGRVIANRGFGVPNAKVSVFIPLSDDENDPEIRGRYPFKAVSDTDSNGVRYNLLEDAKQKPCHTPVGTFPNKRKVLDNDVWLEIYDNYYKFTTTTNEAGDFMIFGVPTGNQKVHMDVDVSDIGFVSVKPYELINQGYAPNLFESNTTFKGGTDLDTLVQVQSRDFNVNVLPFWGDVENNEIGINRIDFNLSVDITPTSVFFGSIFSEERNRGVYKRCKPRVKNGRNCELSTGAGQVEYIRRISNDSNEVEFVSGNNTKIDENGNWAIVVPMNINPVVTDEFGNLIPSEDPTIGIPTEAQVRFRIYMEEFRFGFRKRTANYLVPNMYNRFQFGSDTQDEDFYTLRWKKAYTVTNYIPRYQRSQSDESRYFTGIKRIGDCESTSSFPYNRIDGNINVLYDVLCILIRAVGVIITALNSLLRVIIFNVVLRFVCFVKHPFNSGRRAACRCNSCLRLSSGVSDSPIPIPPPDWGNPPIDSDMNMIDDRLECAACYDGSDNSQTFSVLNGADLFANGSITTDLGGATTGFYGSVSVTTSGNGTGALFDITIDGAGFVWAMVCVAGGSGYAVGDTITVAGADIGSATDVIATLASVDLDTIVIIDGVVIDCDGFDNTLCEGLCQDCQVSIIQLTCDDEEYTNGNEWAECTVQNLAENLGVIVYEFYNDWVIGSLYSYMFDYKVRSRRRRVTQEKFCDYDCFATRDLNDKHGKNVCKDSYIIDKREFNNGSAVRETVDRGLIVEYNNFLYYAARNDVEINTSGATDLLVTEKGKLLFATNLIELGSVVTCDINGEPFVIDRLEPTTHQTDEGVGTLFDVSNCGFPIVTDINFKGIELVCQAGIDVIVAETERPLPAFPNIIEGDDSEQYLINGSETGLPDYDGQDSVIILDRDDVVLRRLLCENFNYFGVSGSYSTAEFPPTIPVDYLTDDDGDIVESTTDVCAGLDNIRDTTGVPADNMPPYYMYFGIKKGTSSLDKLKELYFDNCVD